MARHIHVHVYVPGGRVKVRDAATDFEELVDWLLEQLGQSSPTQDDAEVGHPFYGNQYTDVVLGPKPTTASAKGAKNKVLELFSSGHGFTLKELAEAAGTAGTNPLYNIFADLKKKNGLHIAKNKEGLYNIVKANGELAVAPKPAQAAPKAAAPAQPPTPPAPAPVAAPAAPEITVPAVKMSKGMADIQYANHIEALTQKVAAVYSSGGLPAAAHTWKMGKAQAMAQWATNHAGSLHKPPEKVEVFKEDKDLVEDLVGIHATTEQGSSEAKALIQKALAKWKTATADAKIKASQPKPIPPKAEPATHKPSKPTSIDPTSQALPAGAHALKAPTSIVPDGWEGPIKEDFIGGGGFTTKMSTVKSLLQQGHPDKVANKKGVEATLAQRLQDSPHFKHWAGKFSDTGHGSLVKHLISSWAGSSGDHNKVSCAMQHATMEAFGMQPEHLELKALGALDLKKPNNTVKEAFPHMITNDAQAESFRHALKDFVLAQYHNTQDHLKSLGVTHVCVARGMHTPEPPSPKKGTLKLQPASSFSANLGTAQGSFSGGHSVFFAKVPASQVLSSYVTGFGCTHEHEVVVLAHKGMTAVHTHAPKVYSLEAAKNHIATEVKQWS